MNFWKEKVEINCPTNVRKIQPRVIIFIRELFVKTNILKARGWWPGTLIIFKNIFLTVCVSLSGLGPSETHEKLSMRKICDSSNEKQGEKLFLLWRHSALLVWPFSWLAKNRRQGKSLSALNSIRYGALCRSKLFSPALRGSLVSPRSQR